MLTLPGGSIQHNIHLYFYARRTGVANRQGEDLEKHVRAAGNNYYAIIGTVGIVLNIVFLGKKSSHGRTKESDEFTKYKINIGFLSVSPRPTPN